MDQMQSNGMPTGSIRTTTILGQGPSSNIAISPCDATGNN